MRYRFLITLIFCPLALFGFVVDPWYTPLAEFQLRPSYTYRTYPNVNRAQNPSHYSSDDHLLDLNLGVQVWENWDVQLEADFSDTRKLDFGTQLVGAQLRYLFLNDVAGDPISLSVGGQFFYVPTRNMRDPSSPYHAQGNAELGVAVGKEIAESYDWLFRFYGFLGVGMANRGSPWVRPLVSAAFNLKGCHQFRAFSEGYFGFGYRHHVDITRLNGYGKIFHQSIDIGASYRYLFRIWGSIGVQYTYRLYAKAFPERVQQFLIEYRFPFSIL